MGCVQGDVEGAELLSKEAPGVAGHQEASVQLAQQALGRLQRVRLWEHHLLYVSVGAQGLGNEAAVQAVHLGFPYHTSTVDEGEQQRGVWGQKRPAMPGAKGGEQLGAWRWAQLFGMRLEGKEVELLASPRLSFC